MASQNRRSLDNLMHFKKGESGNPGGRPKLPPELRELQAQTKIEVLKSINAALIMTHVELKRSMTNPDATMSDLLVGSILTKAVKEGCHARAQFLIHYVLGKPQVVELEGEGTPPQPIVNGVPTALLIELMKKHHEASKK